VNRTGITEWNFFNRLTGYGSPSALVQTYGGFIGFNRIFEYRHSAGAPIEGSESLSPSATLRGGWNVGGSVSRSFFSYSPADYAHYQIQVFTPGGPSFVPFTVPGPERDLFSGTLRFTTPTWRLMTATGSVTWGAIPIFREAAPGTQLALSATVDLRPAPAMRVSFQATQRTIDRRNGGSRFSNETIPRLKLEYQLTRAIFFRFVGQYTARQLSELHDRNGIPVWIDSVLTTPSSTREFRMDWLFSYRPTPGTLVYLGYGSTLEAADVYTSSDLKRASDGFFGKASWLFRL
jgi:hypothetical protein